MNASLLRSPSSRRILLASKEWRSVMSSSTQKAAGARKPDMDDNPCWGSQDACSLKELLRKFDSKTMILYESAEYVALNKPPDLRMDGPHSATVLKLLTYLYPTSFLKLKYGHPTSQLNTDLLQLIQEKIHLHGDASALAKASQPDIEIDKDDVPPRPCHQLDYATSGVLWVARTTVAANSARRALETRTGVSKTYAAVVHGHVQVDDSWPVVTRAQMTEWLSQAEDSYRRKRRKHRTQTFDGFLPPHSLFLMYKKQQQQQKGEATSKKRKKKESVALTKTEWQQVWKSVDECFSKEEDRARLLDLSWKTAKKEIRELQASFNQASQVYNQIVRQKDDTISSVDVNSGSDFPLVFRVQEELNDKTFYINVPLAQTSDDFAMRLPPSLKEKAAQSAIQIGDPGLDYKPSLTKCTVEAHDDTNTKVWLEPRTGRRHQLRVHMALLKHAIVGDATYNQSTARLRSGRMCLHAYQLSIDLEGQSLEFRAPDPFRIDTKTNKILVDEI